MKNQTEYNYPLNYIDSQAIFQSDIQISGPNNAEIDALIHERDKLKKEEEDQFIYNQNMKKYKDNIRKYKEKEIRDIICKEEIEKEKKMKRKEKEMYNIQVREKNNLLYNQTLKKNKEKEKEIEKKISKKNSVKSNNNISNEERLNTNSSNNNNEINKEEKEKIILNEKEEEKKNNKEITIDLSNNIKEEIKKYIIPKQKNELINNLLRNEREKGKGKEIINEEINLNLKKIENFRKNGFIDFSEINSPKTPSQTSKKEKKEKTEKFEKKKFKSEFERRRFIKALKNIMTERLGEKNIIIPNICSCGQLQKKLDALIELGNISVLTYGDLECANNCIYYKHPEEFNKGINDVLKSIKQISYNAFNNKYKI